MKITPLFLALIFLGLNGCEEVILKEEFTNSITNNYNAFSKEFNEAYGAMEAKNIDWEYWKDYYGKDLNNQSSNYELYKALCNLLNELNDGHADIYAPGIGYFRSWNRRNKSYFKDIITQDYQYVEIMQSNLRKFYLNNKFESQDVSGWLFFYGTVNYQDKKVGYICIPTFNLVDYPNDFIQTAIDSFNRLDGVIIDLRFNGGGKTEAFVSSLNSFSSESKMYLKSKFKNGVAHNDFTELSEHWTHSHDNCLKNKPVAILMNSFSASSSDHFILGMKSQSFVITVGDTTCGAFSSVNERLLPNGWKFRLGSQVVYNADGTLMCDKNGNYIEGIGIAPDFYVNDYFNESKNGIDPPLDKALAKLVP